MIATLGGYVDRHTRRLRRSPHSAATSIATLGGYVDRPKTEPGPETLWIGLQRLHCFSLA
jgi:hypothetical protein